MKKVTLKDIAAELNVTVGTVSHALNGRRDISADMRERVFETARRLGYITNHAAAALRSGKSRTVGLIVPDISNPHLAYQIKHIEDRMRPHGYTVMILNTNESEETEEAAILTAAGKQVDGILLCPTGGGQTNLDLLDRLEIPYLLIGRYFADRETDYVAADEVKGGYIAGQYLLQSGCREPLYIGAFRSIEGSRARFAGLCRAYEEAGLTLSPDRFVETDPRAAEIEGVLQNLTDAGVSYDAILAFSDIMAYKISSYLQKAGQADRIPVVGFDAINTQLYIPFPHVSVGMVGDGWGEAAARALLAKMGGDSTPHREWIDVCLYTFP